jgi:hypothetical protein
MSSEDSGMTSTGRLVTGMLVLSLAVAGCGRDRDVPRTLASPNATSVQTPTPSPAGSVGFTIDDVELVTQRGDGIRWVLSFDARWTGDGSAFPVKCRWQMFPEGDVESNAIGSVVITGEGDDLTTPPIYPDEVGGLPVTGRIDRCAPAPSSPSP